MTPASGPVNEEVIICRFGSAFSTLTVLLLEFKVYKEIQDEMKRLDSDRLLSAPKFFVGERVCFKNNLGIWTRGKIAAICESVSDNLHCVNVDVVLEDTSETLKRVDGRAFVALPDSLFHLKNANLYFIDGLEPYKFGIYPKGCATSQGAQTSANVLNKQWTLTPAGTMLVRRDALPPENPASRTRLDVATVLITQSVSLLSYVTSFLSDHVVSSAVRERMKLARHPLFKPASASAILCPHTSAEEICEVISLRKTEAEFLEVGLRLSSYLDTGLLKQMLRNRAYGAPWVLEGPAPVSISKAGYFMQRGVLLPNGRILGIDTLESFEQDAVEIRLLPAALAEALPHVGLFIDWNLSLQPRTPCLGDTIVVRNLKEDRRSVLRFTYKDVSFVENPVVINYHPLALREEPPSPEEDTQNEEAKDDTQNEEKKAEKGFPEETFSSNLAEWYGLEGEVPDFFEIAMSEQFDPSLEASLVQFGEAVSIQDL